MAEAKTADVDIVRRLPVGADLQRDGAVHFRCWAPRRRRVRVVTEPKHGQGKAIDLVRDDAGYFSGLVPGIGGGVLYRLRLDEGPVFPDPASRFQPDGPHGPSQVIDPSAYAWRDAGWRGIALAGQVIYEMHVGTFTKEGTWAAAAREIHELARFGITAIELMPVAEFPGEFGWGYDGVGLFAPTRLYGTPDDFRGFVDECHQAGVGVLLDVVYNHVGPDGSYLSQFSDRYFTDRYENEWGEAINFDGPGSGPVREFFTANAGYWIDEYHLDGLRLDATQQMFDRSPEHILADIVRAVRQRAKGRGTIVIGENEPQHTLLVRPTAQGGCGLDALWNDDFHHSAMVAATGHSEAYYTDYRGTSQEFVSVAKRGFLYQGQMYAWQKKRRGTSTLGLEPGVLVNYLQNHDQVANSGHGERLDRLTSPGRLRALTALLLLGPQTPMLFQGQEFAASSPFLYFADHVPELAGEVREGRLKFLAQFPSLATPDMRECLADPGSRETFERSKIDLAERDSHAGIYALHRDLLRLRREDPVIGARRRTLDGAVLTDDAFVLRFFAGSETAGDRLLVVNLGRDLHLPVVPEPLLAPPEGATWRLAWSTEMAAYGGCGTPAFENDSGWWLPGHAALVLGAAATRSKR